MSTKEIQEKLVDNMRRWHKIENASVASTGKVIEKTENPIIRIVMEIIQRDSQFHYRVQDLFEYRLEGKAGQAGIGTLTWTGLKSVFRDETKVRILGDSWNLTKKILDADR